MGIEELLIGMISPATKLLGLLKKEPSIKEKMKEIEIDKRIDEKIQQKTTNDNIQSLDHRVNNIENELTTMRSELLRLHIMLDKKLN